MMAGRALFGRAIKTIASTQPLNAIGAIGCRQFNIPNATSSRTYSDDAPIDIENPFKREKQLCILCKFGIDPDYKNVKLLSQFQSPYTGRVYSRNITGLCKHKQMRVMHEVVRAQNAGLMPYYLKDMSFIDDPKLFNPDKPLIPHSY